MTKAEREKVHRQLDLIMDRGTETSVGILCEYIKVIASRRSIKRTTTKKAASKKKR